MFLFADDAKIFRQVMSLKDHDILQDVTWIQELELQGETEEAKATNTEPQKKQRRLIEKFKIVEGIYNQELTDELFIRNERLSRGHK